MFSKQRIKDKPAIENNKVTYLKGLNGIRAIAAISVVISHTLLELDYFGIKVLQRGWDFASYGVTMFFTLSGFLITYLLLKEKSAFDTVNIKEFYIRRVLRIWPLYYLYILFVLVVLLYSFPEVLPGSLYYYLFLAANIPAVLNISLPFLTHYWSLGVEEQFYLFWPWLIKFFNPLKAIVIFLIVFISFKLILSISIPQSLLYMFIYRAKFDCLAIGALWAALATGNNSKSFNILVFNRITQIVSWSILLLTAFGKFKIPDFISQDVFSVATANIILNVALNKNTLINLENAILNFLGKISYGIYVYHVLIIYILGRLLKGRIYFIDGRSHLLVIMILVLSITITIAWCSHEFFEKYFLKLKSRFSKIQSHSESN